MPRPLQIVGWLAGESAKYYFASASRRLVNTLEPLEVATPARLWRLCPDKVRRAVPNLSHYIFFCAGALWADWYTPFPPPV